MATIAGLAIKIQANFGNIVRDAQVVADNVNNLSRVVRQSAPSMQQLEQATGAAGTALETFTEMMNQPGIDANFIDQTEKSVNKLLDSIGTLGDRTAQQFSKLPPTFDSVNKALESTQKLMSFQDVVNNNLLINNVDEIDNAIRRMTTESGELLKRFAENIKNISPNINGLKTAIDQMQNVQTAAANFKALGGDVQVADDAIRAAHESVTSIGQSIADGILDIRPGMEGLMKANREVQRLRDLIEATGTTNELQSALDAATANVATLASQTMEAATQMTMFQSVVFGMNNLPFEILHDLLKSIAGTIQKMFPVSDQMKQVAAVLFTVVTLIGLASTSTARSGLAAGTLGTSELAIGTYLEHQNNIKRRTTTLRRDAFTPNAGKGIAEHLPVDRFVQATKKVVELMNLGHLIFNVKKGILTSGVAHRTTITTAVARH